MEYPVDANTADEAQDGEPIDDDDKAKNHTRNPIWDGPPSPPDPEVVIKDPSCHGTIAVALHNALMELQQHDTIKSIEQQYHFQFDVNKVMQVFGESIVQNQQDQYAQHCKLPNPTRETQQQQLHDNNNNNSKNIAPAALLRGKIQHYNRYGTKWRFVVKDAEIIPRIPFHNHQQQLRKRNRTSLYDMTESALLQQADKRTSLSSPPPSSSLSSVSIKISQLEILVYNDVE